MRVDVSSCLYHNAQDEKTSLKLISLNSKYFEKIEIQFPSPLFLFPHSYHPPTYFFLMKRKKIKHMLTVKGYRVDATLLPLIEVMEFRKGKYLYQTGRFLCNRRFMTW